MCCFLLQQQQYLLFIVLSWASNTAVLLEDSQSSWLGAKEVLGLSGCSSSVSCISQLPLSLSTRLLWIPRQGGQASNMVWSHGGHVPHGPFRDCDYRSAFRCCVVVCVSRLSLPLPLPDRVSVVVPWDGVWHDIAWSCCLLTRDWSWPIHFVIVCPLLLGRSELTIYHEIMGGCGKRNLNIL